MSMANVFGVDEKIEKENYELAKLAIYKLKDYYERTDSKNSSHYSANFKIYFLIDVYFIDGSILIEFIQDPSINVYSS